MQKTNLLIICTAVISLVTLLLLISVGKSLNSFAVTKNASPCEIVETIAGYDYSSAPVKQSIAELRTVDWAKFRDPASNLTFTYPGNLRLSTANLDSLGSIEIYPNETEPLPIIQIHIERELLKTDGWSVIDVFNNQNDINAQLNNIIETKTGVDYFPCIPDVSNENRLLVKTDNELHLFLKDTVHYVHATFSIPYVSLFSLEEATLILNSVRFEGN